MLADVKIQLLMSLHQLLAHSSTGSQLYALYQFQLWNLLYGKHSMIMIGLCASTKASWHNNYVKWSSEWQLSVSASNCNIPIALVPLTSDAYYLYRYDANPILHAIISVSCSELTKDPITSSITPYQIISNRLKHLQFMCGWLWKKITSLLTSPRLNKNSSGDKIA